MPYIWKPSGTSAIISDSLPSLVGNKFGFTVENVVWSASRYLFSQAGSASGRVIALLRYGTTNERLAFYLRGSPTTVSLNVATDYGDATLRGTITGWVYIDTGAYSITVHGITKTGTASIGTDPDNNILFRLGSTGSSSVDGDLPSANMMVAGDQAGNAHFSINDVVYRSFIMPSSGTAIPEIVSGHTGTLQSPTGNDFEATRPTSLTSELTNGLAVPITPTIIP